MVGRDVGGGRREDAGDERTNETRGFRLQKTRADA